MARLCLIFNMASWYREAIYRAIDNQYDCDWYFGHTEAGIKEMDVSHLNNVRYYKVIGNPTRVSWKIGVLKLLFKKDYTTYLMIAEVRSISDWIFFWLASTFFPRKKVYIWTHGWYGREAGIIRRMKLWLYRHVTGTFVYGDRAKRLLLEQGISQDRLFAIHNSLDYDNQKQIRDSLCSTPIYQDYFHNADPIILFIGRLTAVKKLDMLVKALESLNNRGLSCNLVFVGDGSEKQRLQREVEEKHLQDRVWFYGACYEETKNAELVYNASVCVSPGNVGLTSIHALMYGCPVITHDKFEWQMPEYEVITPEVTGDFFVYNQQSSLNDTIYNWLVSQAMNREKIRQACYNIIDSEWNPNFQMDVIKKNIKM